MRSVRGSRRPAEDLLIGPVVFDRLAVSGMVRTEGEELQALWSGLEGPRRRGGYANGVQRSDIEELAVELDPAASAEDDIDLLGIGMSMREGAALPGKQ